jgi:hypothetical protein
VYDRFMERALKRVAAVKQGNPLDPTTMIGAQASSEQLEKILSYMDIGRQEGAKVLTGGERNVLDGDLEGGYYVKPTVFEGHNKMRIFQEEIFGPVVSVCTFKDEDEALSIANDTLYGLGAGVWSRDANRCYRFGRGIQAGRVWTNCYHAYPAHAAFGGYKQSGIGRETHSDDAGSLSADEEYAGELFSLRSWGSSEALTFLGSHPSHKNNGVARVGHPDFLWITNPTFACWRMWGWRTKSGFPSGMTDRKARTSTRANAEAGPSLCSG